MASAQAVIRWTEQREEESAVLPAAGADALSGRLGHHARGK
ncbi:hypothetical protein OH809_07140 [Streptomyces sp. NBC_00873]|nr:hypothetical protein OH809_07140 [Streptomyces sp. NBC_00873]WTA47449.1 hypothetical protein OH821_36625 [Streptomyces sp. NBC_00842]